MSANSRPLEGVKVVELATFIAAPSCSRLLGDLGAEVIKVEAPKGDAVRFTAVNEGRPYGDDDDTTYALENTGKKFITLNTKTEAGRKILEELIAQADIFITNWRLKALERSNLDFKTLHEKYPSLVMGLVSGYGETGPDKDLPGFDFTAYFSRSGIMGTMFDVDSIPMNPVAGFGDHQVGMNLAAGLLAALYRAKRTGEGDEVIVSLFHSGAWDVAIYLQAAQYGDPSTQYPISRKSIANQLQMAHKTSDGRWFMICMPQYDAFYNKFMKEVLQREDLVDDPRYFPQTNLQANLAEFYDLLVAEIGKISSTDLAARMTAADIPFSLCQTWQDVLHDPQAWESGILAKVKMGNGEERTMVRPPITFQNTPPAPYNRAPYMGEHSREILASLGYSEEEIEALFESGAASDIKRIK